MATQTLLRYSNSRYGSPLIISRGFTYSIHIAAPEEEDVEYLEVSHAGGGEEGRLAFLVRVVHISAVLQQDLAHLSHLIKHSL